MQYDIVNEFLKGGTVYTKDRSREPEVITSACGSEEGF